MFERYFLYGCIAVFVVQTAARAGVVIAASWYDFRRAAAKRTVTTRRRKPLISVLVLAKNDGSSITACLESIRSARAKKYEIIVINNASTDDTKQQLAAFVAKQGRKPVVRVINKRKRSPDKAAYVQGLGRASGEVVLLLDGKSLLPADTLGALAAYFMSNTTVEGMQLAQRTTAYPSIFALQQRYASLVGEQLYKAGKPPHGSHAAWDVGTAWQAEALKRAVRGATLPALPYASWLIVDRQPVLSFRQTMRRLASASLAVKLFEPFMLTYFFYLAYSFRSSALLVASWLSLSLWLAVAVWSADRLQLRTRLALTVALPMTYVLYYVAAVYNCVTVLIQASAFCLHKVSIAAMGLVQRVEAFKSE